MGRREPPRDWRRIRLGLLAALVLTLTVAAHLRPVYRVTVAGKTLPGLYSPLQTTRCVSLARETAEELLENGAKEPELGLRLRLTLRRADAGMVEVE